MALTDNIISYYKCQGNANDELGTNNGTATGTVTFSDANGIIGNGAGISGASPLANYISLGTSSTLSPTALTINMWVKYDTPTEAWGAPYSKYATGDKFHLILVNKTSNQCFWLVSATTDIAIYPGSHTLVAGNSYMLTMTYDSTGGLKTYVNATDDGTAAANGNLNTTAPTNTYIGGDPSGSDNGRPWQDAVDEIGIWSRALTSTEITELYNGGSGLTYPFSASSGPANVKTVNGIAKASVKTINGIAIASVKSVNGIA